MPLSYTIFTALIGYIAPNVPRKGLEAGLGPQCFITVNHWEGKKNQQILRAQDLRVRKRQKHACGRRDPSLTSLL